MDWIDGEELTSEPTGEKSSDQTEKVVEDRDNFGNDPGDNPENNGNSDPGTKGEESPL